MKNIDNIKKEQLFNELWKCLDRLRGYADMNSLLMPLFYVLCAHHEGHLLSILNLSDGPNIFAGEKSIQPVVDAEMNNIESDLLKRIRRSVDERYFHGKTVQIIYDFYQKNNELIKQYYPELIEHIFALYSRYAGKYTGMFATPKEITQIMYHLALREGIKSIYDPCAGLCSGVLLDEMNGHKFIGQEIDKKIKLFADIRLDAHNKRVALYNEDVSAKWRGQEADCLCSDLPIGVSVDNDSYQQRRKEPIEEYILSKFIETPSIKRAVVLLRFGFCFDRQSFDMRKTLVEKNYVDTIIQLPAGVLSYSGVNTAILVLDKERRSTEVRLVSATDCFTRGEKPERAKVLDTEELLSRLAFVDHKQVAICNVDQFFRRDCSFDPAHYIANSIAMSAGQKLVNFTDLATEIRRNSNYDDTEGYELTQRHMRSSIAEFHATDPKFKSKPLSDSRLNKLTQPGIIFNLRADKFFIKTNDQPLFIPLNYRVFKVDTSKCLPEYLILVVLKSQDLIKNAMGGAGAPRINYNHLMLPIFEDLETQRQIVEREYRQEAQQLRKKLERLQTLSGQSSDLLHNLGITFTRLDAAIANLQRELMHQGMPMEAEVLYQTDMPSWVDTIQSLNDNIKYSLRLINSTGTDFSKSEPTKVRVVLEDVIGEYIDSWQNFGYSTFSIMPLKSDLPNTKVEVDIDMLYTALDCILINAHQHGFHKRGSETNRVLIELKPVTIDGEKFALISVSNNGDPLPDGFTLQDFAARGVVGLNSSQDGLGGHHVTAIAHLHNGHVAIEQSTEWLSLHVLIPTYINDQDTVFDEYGCEYL